MAEIGGDVWPRWYYMGPIWAHIGPRWDNVWPRWQNIGLMWDNMGPRSVLSILLFLLFMNKMLMKAPLAIYIYI